MGAATGCGLRIWALEILAGLGFVMQPGKSPTWKGQVSARMRLILQSRLAQRRLPMSINSTDGR